jgi:putative transposase
VGGAVAGSNQGSVRQQFQLGPMKINLSQTFAGQTVGVKQVKEKIWLVSFTRYDLGFFDHETCRIESAESPLAAKVLPMSPV